MSKQNLPNNFLSGSAVVGENFLEEKTYYETLFVKSDKTITGQETFTTINGEYDTSDYPSDTDVNNKGELGMMNLLAKYVLADYLITAEDFNGKLDKSGGTMTGALTLAGDPTEDLHAAPKQYVDDTQPLAGTYTGNGSADRTISLAFTPSAVLILGYYGSYTGFLDTSRVYGGLMVTGSPIKNPYNNSANVGEIVANGFKVYNNDIIKGYANYSGIVYNYIAFR